MAATGATKGPFQQNFVLSGRGNRRFLNNFPLRSYVENMSADSGPFGWQVTSLDTILKRDNLRTIPLKFGPKRPSSFREDFKNIFP